MVGRRSLAAAGVQVLLATALTAQTPGGTTLSFCTEFMADPTTIDKPPVLAADGTHVVTPQAAAPLNCRWNKLDLTVSFWGGTPYDRNQVRNAVPDWEAVSGIRFVFVGDNDTNADIRVAFFTDDGNWSQVGSCLLQRTTGPYRPAIQRNMNIAQSWSRAVILHEFGHAIGLIHEHQSPAAGVPWDKPAVYAYYARTEGWDAAKVDHNIFARYERPLTKFTEFDRWSIMLYQIPNELTIGDYETNYNYWLSELDKAFISTWYPPRTGWGSGHTPQDRVADMNGDGRDDVIQIHQGKSYVWLSTGFGFQPYTQWGSAHTDSDRLGDFNGDGKADVIQIYQGKSYVWLSTGTGFQAYTQWGMSHTDADKLGDFNGDGRTDVIQIFQGKAYVWLSTGTTFAAYTLWNSGHLGDSFEVGDFNGDGLSDVLQFSNGQSYVWISSGHHFMFRGVWGSSHTAIDRPADFNGDGRTDIIQLYQGKSYVWLSTGTAFQPYTNWGTGHTPQDQLGDFNGDGKMDVVQFYDFRAYVWLSTGTTFAPYTVWGLFDDARVIKLGDFNGDGRSDVITFIEQTQVSHVKLSAGGTFATYAPLSVPPAAFSLKVTLAGTGTGFVATPDDQIHCVGDCQQQYQTGTSVTLVPHPIGSGFVRWDGDADCADGVVQMTADRLCTAVFDQSATYVLAEGATGPMFDTDILLANPNQAAAPIALSFLKEDGTSVPQTRTLAPTSRMTIPVESIPGLEWASFSTVITSTNGLPLIVERTMRWDARGYGSHTERAAAGEATTWYFAEGAQGWFDTFILLANPGAATNHATVQFLREGASPITKDYDMPPTSRLTVYAGAIPELANQAFGTIVTFANPGMAERAMYFGVPVFNGGHESAGVTAPSSTWFLAEGATGSFFTTFLLMANPGASDAQVTITYLPSSGVPVTKSAVLPARQRLTINLAAEDPSLADTAVSTTVHASVPILVERAQYWPSTPDRWYEAHNSFGEIASGTRWGLAEGRVGGPEGYQTYILLANPGLTAAQVSIRFLRENGTTVDKTFTVAPTSRFNVHVNGAAAELVNESFGAVIEATNGVPIFVERALYSNAMGMVWAAGSNALATRLP